MKKILSKIVVIKIQLFHYGLIVFIGLTLIYTSFITVDKWSNILTGIGTGLFTSLSVAILIEKMHEREQSNKNRIDKELFLRDITYYAQDIYMDILDRINEFQLNYYKANDWISALYNDDNTKLNEFLNKLAAINYSSVSENEKKLINILFNIRNYRLDALIGELKKLPKEELYLRDILNKDEYENIVSSKSNEMYLHYIRNVSKFWNDEVIDIKECSKFMKLTLHICTRVIKNIDTCRISIANKETNMMDYYNEQYYSKVYSQTDEYIEKYMEDMQAREEHYFESFDEKSDISKNTEESKILKDLNYAISSWSTDKVTDLLESSEEWDKESFELLCKSKMAQILMKDKRLKKLFKRKFNKKYKANLKWEDLKKVMMN